MPTAVLTRCNSGIGYETAKIALQSGWKVYALDIVQGEKLKSLEGQNCKISRLDVTSPESIAQFKRSIGDEPIDLAIGIMPDPTTEDSLETVTLKRMEKCFAINTYGPFLLTQALLPNLLAAPAPRRLAVISPRFGSIADNTSGGYFAYRPSKTAVNPFLKGLAVELKEKDVVVTMLHPGFTNTNLSAEIKNIPGVVEPNVSRVRSGRWYKRRLWLRRASSGIEMDSNCHGRSLVEVKSMAVIKDCSNVSIDGSPSHGIDIDIDVCQS